MYTYNKKKAL